MSLLDEPSLPTKVEPRAPDLLSVISRAAADPAVDVLKMEALLRLQREIMADHAKAAFYAALTRLTDKIPPVKKNGTISLGQGREVAFAKWEDIMKVIAPLLREEGMALTFTSRSEGSELVVVGSLVHELGYSISSEMSVPYDVGPGRNALQARGSSRTYGQRYVAEMLLNIVREGQDDDGMGGPPAPTRRGRAPAGWRPNGADEDVPVLTREQFNAAPIGTRYRMHGDGLGKVYVKKGTKP
jgi:hypothetical protein